MLYLADPGNETMDDYNNLLNLESPYGYGKSKNINCLFTYLH